MSQVSQTISSRSGSPTPYWHLGYWLFVGSGAVYFSALRFIFNRDFPLATMQALIDGSAYRPFQYRILTPWLVGQAHELTGLSIRALYQSFEALAVIGVVITLRYLLAPYFQGKARDVFSAAILLVLPWNYLLPREIAIFIPSDLPAVMFFTLLLALMSRGKWRWYYPLFALATLNRETTCFVTLLYLLVSWKRVSPKEMWLHIGAQFIIWVLLKFWLAQVYAANPGSMFEIYGIAGDRTHLDSNIEFLFSPLRVLVLLSSFGFLWAPVMLWRKRIDELFIREGLVILAPFFLVMMLIGNVNETRIFGEFAPLVYVGALLLMKKASAHGWQSLTS